jgi:hypothetical protein
MQTLGAVAPALEKAVQYTRGIEDRVDAIERAEEPLRASRLDFIRFKSRGLMGRLAWVLTGR